MKKCRSQITNSAASSSITDLIFFLFDPGISGGRGLLSQTDFTVFEDKIFSFFKFLICRFVDCPICEKVNE